jgi:tRNA-Thr(GGU) m(6)t(6)A37 methyltransferase TsaA
MKEDICYKAIGVIHSPFKQPEGTPIQAGSALGTPGTVDLYAEFVEGLKDLIRFSHIYILYHFHLAVKPSLIVQPFLDQATHGIFATRAPSRPNPIGISVVKLVGIEEATLHIEDVDVVDGTPLLDLKPYVPIFDCPKATRIGWLEGKTRNLHSSRADSRFTR